MTQAIDSPLAGTGQSGRTGSQAVKAAVARGRIIESRPGLVIFQPKGTTYELHLETGAGHVGPVGKPVQGRILVKVRKLYTVPSGGNFLAPILGPPRTVQGRVIAVTPTQIVVQAGAPVVLELPNEPHATDLGSGPIEEGAIVNAVAFPGARFELSGV